MPDVKLPLLVLCVAGPALLTSCGRRADVAPAPMTPEATVEAFLDAANAGNIEAMAALWGDERGPSNVSGVIPPLERARRLTVMQRMLRSDSRRLVNSDDTAARLPVRTYELTQGTRRFSVPFTCVTSRYGGWLVREIGLEAAMPAATPRP